jgi:hypothetical protein
MNMNIKHAVLLINAIMLLVSVSIVPEGNAGIPSKVTKEAWEYIAKKCGKEIAEEGGEKVLKSKFEKLVLKHGDKVIPVIKKVGPRGINIAEKYGDDAIRAMSKYGDNALIVLRRNADEVIPLIKRYGDNAMGACIKHPGVGKNFVSEFGKEGIEVANKVSTQKAIKLLRMSKEIKGSGKAEEILKGVEKYGGKFINHLAKHKTLYFIYGPTGVVITKGGLDFVENPSKYIEAGFKGLRTGITGKGSNEKTSTVEGTINNVLIMVFLLVIILVPPLFYIFLRHKRKSLKQKPSFNKPNYNEQAEKDVDNKQK